MKLLLLAAVGLLLGPLAQLPATAQALDPTFISPATLYGPAQVYALGPQQADGKRLVSGNFTSVGGTPVGRLIRLDASGTPDAAFNRNVGAGSNVYRIKPLPNGQYLLGANGGSVTIGSTSRVELLRLNADGTPDNSFFPGTGPSFTNEYPYVQDYAVQANGKVVVVGYFEGYNGVPAGSVARLNADGSLDTGFNTGTGISSTPTQSNSAFAVVAQPNGKVLVGGYFDTFNGTPQQALVRLEANGSLDASFSSPLLIGSQVEGVTLQPDGKLLVNGLLNLPSSAGSTSAELVRLLPSGALDNTFSATVFPNGTIATYNFGGDAVQLQADGRIVVAGYFTLSQTQGLARLNSDGSLDNTFRFTLNPTDNAPAAFSIDANGSVVVGSASPTFSTLETNLVRLSSTGTPDLSFAPRLQVAGSVNALLRQPDGRLVLGGNFTEFNGQSVHRLVRLATNGTLETGFSAATGILPGVVSTLALQPDGKLLAGTQGQGLYRFNPTGSPDQGFNAGTLATSNLVAVALQPDGRILVTGNLNVSRGLVRLTSTGALDPTFSRITGGSVGNDNSTGALLVQADGKIVVAGLFRPAGQPAVARVVRYEPSGNFDPTFNNLSAFTAANGISTSTNRVLALAQQPDGKLLVGGNFEAVDGTLHYGVARLTTTGVVDATFAPNALLTGTVFALARQPNGRVLLGGSFNNSSSAGTQANLARVLDNGQTDTSFGNTATPSGLVRSLVVQPDGAIVLAGSIFSVGSQPAAAVARITASNVLAVAAPAAVAERTAAWPVPAHGQLHVRPDASAHPRTVELLDALGRPVLALPVGTAPELTLNVERLPAGIYLLRVTYEAGAVTRRVAVQ